LRKANRIFQEASDPLGHYWGWSGGTSGFFTKNFTILHALNVGRDPAENKKAREIFLRLVQAAADNGWSEYRSAPGFQDAIMNVFSFNNHALLRFLETVKDAIDPNGIVSAGRYGIWPKHLRKGAAA
jgi:(+)-pinoresinol hydroxylase